MRTAAATIFLILFLVSLVLLIWGLISPRSLSRAAKKPLTRRSAFIGYGLFALAFFVLTGVTAPQSSTTNKPNDETAAHERLDADTAKEAKEVSKVTTRTVTETEPIPFESTTVNDATLTKGTSKVTTTGVNGVKKLTYKVTYADDKETGRELVGEEVTTQPVTQITSVGTKTQTSSSSSSQSCDPNYSGACVPNVYPSDVDCGGGSGNGPYYVYGTVHVVGTDLYDLDRDGNGYACDW